MPKRKNKKSKIKRLPSNNTHVMPAQLQNRRIEMAASKTEHFQGPLPHPTILKAYDIVLPGLAERIIGAWEKQTNHRISLEQLVINGDNNRANWGLFSATAITITVIIACTILAIMNKEQALIAIGVIVLNLTSLAGIFVYGSYSRRREREKKLAKVK
jgi:uncharacterized membrane protein